MAEPIPDFDLYAELEVSERASVETIQAAYRSLQARHHPDRVGAAGADRAVRLNIARDWLTDPDRRARYDAVLANRRVAPESLEDDGTGETDDGLDAVDDAEPGTERTAGPSPLRRLRRQLRIDLRRLGRVWIVGLALIGTAALVPSPIPAGWAQIAASACVVLVLLGLGLGWHRGRDEAGFAATLVRWIGMALGWAALGVLAVQGVVALLATVRHEPVAAGVADLVLPVMAGAALLSLFAVRRRHGSAETTVDEFLEMTPREFETEVGRILGRHGYRLRVTGGPGDLVADLTGTDPDGRPAVVQCKRYAPGHPVGSRDVQLLIAMGVRHHGAERLVLVTTSDFTDPARDLADELGVELISGEDLEDLTR